jgi:hypothetical protein
MILDAVAGPPATAPRERPAHAEASVSGRRATRAGGTWNGWIPTIFTWLNRRYRSPSEARTLCRAAGSTGLTR